MQYVPLGTAALSNGPVTIILRLLTLSPAGVLARTLPDVPGICDGDSGFFHVVLFVDFFSTEKKYSRFCFGSLTSYNCCPMAIIVLQYTHQMYLWEI